MTDHRWFELAAPYALDALGAEERASFEAHLAACAACRAEVHALREMSGLLAHAAPAATPPPGLRERILEEARRAPRIGRARAPSAGRAAPRWPPAVPWLAAAAGLVLAVVAGVNAWRDQGARAGLARALDTARAALDSQSALIAAITDPAGGTATLAATGKGPAMRLYWNRARRVLVVAAFDLPPAPPGRTYQLWGITQGAPPVSLGVFNTPPGGRGILRLTMPAGVTPTQSAVTEEPAGGSPQPTQQPFLVGAWTGP